MKKIFLTAAAVILTLAMLLTTVSCRDKGSDKTDEPTAEPKATEEPVDTSTVNPLMWRVTDDAGNTLYLFGTIHVGDKRNEAVMSRISGVVDGCDALAVEFDAVAYAADMQRMMNDMMQYVLTDGSVVSDYMPADLYDRAYKLLNKAGLMPALFVQYNLAWWAQLVDSAMMVVYTDLDTEKAMDSLLIKHANEKGLQILEVESSEFQMGLLNSFDNELYLMMIESALDGADVYGEELARLYELWLSGDRDALWKYLTEEDAPEEGTEYTEEQLAMIETYNRLLLDDRNIGMKDKAISYLESGKTVFFAVGAAHMANEVGLVKLLTDAGYNVEEIKY